MFLFIITLVDALSTVLGAVLGVYFQNISKRVSNWIVGFAAGVMLSAAVFGLIQTSVEMGGDNAALVTVLGIFAGMIFLKLLDRLIPHLHSVTVGALEEAHPTNRRGMNRALLFVLAIAIHNFPEGAAVGVSFGTGNMANVISIAMGIGLQNIPEGMAVIAPLIAAGVSRSRAFFYSCFTALVEAGGVMFGYLAANTTEVMLPFALAFAGGAMLYVVSDELIPESHNDNTHGSSVFGATESLILGFCTMMLMDFYI